MNYDLKRQFMKKGISGLKKASHKTGDFSRRDALGIIFFSR